MSFSWCHVRSFCGLTYSHLRARFFFTPDCPLNCQTSEIMKGKGKKERDSDDDCPLMFIDFKSVDFKDYNRLNMFLTQRDEQNVSIEDLDCLQCEIESILTAIITRKLQLESEMESLINWPESKADDKKSHSKVNDSVRKRNILLDEKVPKKFKESHQLNQQTPSCSAKSHSLKFKNKTQLKHPEIDYNNPPQIPSQTPPTTRNDLPDKFWKFVEPYCAPIKSEDIKFLEDMLKQCEVEDEIFKIPPLGKNLKWSNETSWNKQNDVKPGSSIEKKKGLSPYNSSSLSEKSSRKGRESRVQVDKSSFGYFTHRLISCLMEDSISHEENVDKGTEFNDSLTTASPNLNGINLGNTVQLEREIKRELEEQGLLDPDSIPLNDVVYDEDDEILNELIKCQNELKLLSSKNEATLKFLLDVAKKDVYKQELDSKLKEVDQEVMSIYRKILCAKQKKRSLTKKEKDAATKALKEREVIVKQINALE